ncbi:tRNA (pseudouridine(54)-N(1))-methyltransferase TrmY [Oleiphilus sp. HI0071]|jgi:tRNA (pseudouridine54-N1)-methyltransferase|uniref:tRNA (pseudouridine(54)-N(1))-methyltransferase TrmY n=1 Tax=unclassified Oleiphilus TaxID=2631174 RepID=UPI0007C2969E|nr:MULTISPECIES: tRNA (pseudouridine(54)-N(1))-methyltransferase TrmY [unclassified Oleiphilus]KZY73457.1 tRNA (pseudouridine(54)-N(1))-methyltransferase TrmY [Oleiphilus sp. HI0065]KZY80271.1 tRNA (pseudouridine(54)-N(1))-methyltransferase TrmY [Oleiphilus sp. HI0071]KZY93415.1 tRNA (pseudouridine(54)-N(1))-methyltransferase TrmY [Oleiphilus sp. HI0073]KZZ52408.1 tRNA (pseudouridine(54)-N(1))-methyltransferase TrmY [Oleiphilus sp. HI0118]KZZ58950.1 tRNA (pseudouridine(54)-N(1))-methyltransfer
MTTTFVLRARAAPTDPDAFLAEVGLDAHTEIIAHTLMNAMFVAQSHRDNVIVHVVLESTADFSRTVTFTAEELSNIGGFHEAALLEKVARALRVSVGMRKEQEKQVEPGLRVRTLSFERLVKELAEEHALYMMDIKGESIREVEFKPNPCFILTDHIPMPKKSYNTLKRYGTEKLNLGPRMLFASQCVVLIHNELDRLF